MTLRTRTASWLFLACCSLASICVPLDTQHEGMDVAVVINSKNSLTDIKLTMLRKLVLGEETFWGNRLSVVVVLNEEGSAERLAMLRVASLNESQFRQNWVARVFRGEAPSEPVTVRSTEVVLDLVEKNPGAVAFVPGMELPKDVKVLRVDGHLPGEQGYPIH